MAGTRTSLLFEKLRAETGGVVGERIWDRGLGRIGCQHSRKAGALIRRLLPGSRFLFSLFRLGGHHRHRSTIVLEKLQLEQVNMGRS